MRHFLPCPLSKKHKKEGKKIDAVILVTYNRYIIKLKQEEAVMNQLKRYNNLYPLYCKSRRKIKIPFFICLALFVLAFATFLIDSFPFGVSLTMFFMIFPAILFGVLWLIASIRTKKQLKAFSPQQLTMINQEIPSSEMYENILVTSQAVICAQLGLQLVPMSNILWIYANVMTTKLNGVLPIHKSTTLVFANRDHKQPCFHIKNNQKAFQFVQAELLKYRLDFVFGYERGMDDIYKNDINRLIAFSLECADKRKQEAEKQKTEKQETEKQETEEEA